MESDKIVLEGMVFYGYHGATPAEQELGQRFIVDLEVHLDLRAAGQSDAIEDTVSYTRLYNAVKKILEGPSRNLLENVASAVAENVLAEFDIHSVKVQVKKPEVPVKGSVLSHAAVEIFRSMP